MEKNDFCIFILSHGRANKVLTYNSLKKAGCKIPIYIIIDNEDKTANEYYGNFGRDNVVMFDKLGISKTFDTGDNFNNRKCIIYARNACFEIAKKLGYTYFLELDDDYTHFGYRFNAEGKYSEKTIHQNIDSVLLHVLNFYKSIPALTISLSQSGDYVGGKHGAYVDSIKIKRKAMNSFFCSTERPFQFVGRINEDVNTYTKVGSMGGLIFQINNVCLYQLQTQSNSGGMTETYLDGGTYLKSFYTIMYSPSCTKINLMGYKNMRLHHKINWNTAVPKIISEDLKK